MAAEQDVLELASYVVPGLAANDLNAVANALGLNPAQTDDPLSRAELAIQLLLKLRERLAGLPTDTLGHLARLSVGLSDPLRSEFLEAERARRRDPAAEIAGQRSTLFTVPAEPPEPLGRSTRSRRIDVLAARAALQPDGSLARLIPAFEARDEQIRMLEAVTESFNAGGQALIEAGTGTGKSLAYLIPAALYAAANRRRVVVSTNTINLQDQLFHKDLPPVMQALGTPIRTAILKGRSNYLCLRRWLQLLSADRPSAAERSLLIKTLIWLPVTCTGDVAELRLGPGESEAWAKLAATTDACTPSRCSYHRASICFVARARRIAEASHVVVVNHSLLLVDLVNRTGTLPGFDHLIVDEAHHLEDEATTQLGWSASGRELYRHLDELRTSSGASSRLREATDMLRKAGATSAPSFGAVERSVSAAREALEDFISALRGFLAGHGQRGEAGQPIVRLTRSARSQPAWSQVEVCWGSFARVAQGLARQLTDLGSALELHASQGDESSEVVGFLEAELAFWSQTHQRLDGAIGNYADDTISWLSLAGDDVSIRIAPLDVSESLERLLFGAKETVVATSATLTTEGRFNYIRDRLGLPDASELNVGSPFDYDRTTLVYLPSDLPEPDSPTYQRAVEQVIAAISEAIHGRTLVLFTSHSQLRATHHALRERFQAAGIGLLSQGLDGSSRARLLEAFKRDQPAVLLGTSSFWEGVDVVGEALSCLIIPRLPFASPGDPIFQARSELFEDPFRSYAVPQAVLRFRQGFGRLIRSQSDRGALVVLDGRIRSRSYGASFLRSLPGGRIENGPSRQAAQRVREWLEPTLAGQSAQDQTS